MKQNVLIWDWKVMYGSLGKVASQSLKRPIASLRISQDLWSATTALGNVARESAFPMLLQVDKNEGCLRKSQRWLVERV